MSNTSNGFYQSKYPGDKIDELLGYADNMVKIEIPEIKEFQGLLNNNKLELKVVDSLPSVGEGEFIYLKQEESEGLLYRRLYIWNTSTNGWCEIVTSDIANLLSQKLKTLISKESNARKEADSKIESDLLSKLDFKEGNGNDIDTYLDDEPTLYKITTDGTTLFNPYYLIVMKCSYSMIPGVTVKTHVQYKIASHGIYRRYYMDGVRVESYWTGWEELSPGTDTTPTESSKKFITSGGVYEALQNQGNTISISCGYGVSAEVDPQTYVCTFNLLNANGDVISTSSIDLPLESMVVSGEYNAENKTVILTLKSGDNVEFSIADLVSGLVSQSDIVNSLDSTDTTKPLSAAQGKVLNDSKADKPNITNSTETTVSTELSDNTELIYAEVSSISVTFPASVGLDYTSSIIFSTPATIPENYSTFPSDVYFKGDECDGGIFIPNATTRYTMLFYYDGTKIIGLVSGVEI